MKAIKKALRKFMYCRFHSIKTSTNGTTYDRYDPKFGLHSK
ncbi:hypothetical protein KPBMHCEF_00091 [Salmonella phage EH3]|uniref:Uncharacterized protein n=2 Tax=Epseptimavirus TaxID=2732017 RepID=A0A3P4A7F5_9CAUD|nr:hypothetical protein HOV60_gp161 [Escherichia phage vB_Eco_mar003J3]QDK00017.1 hypothetical protein HEDJPLGI_00121 [Escherichia phage vB_EcoS-26175I]QDK00185.1 hypothetical protein EGCEDKNN_00110 [Escherichia phage vB_EcoS-26175II]QDK00294.1 hypothetical protein INCEGHDL_00082 [Escherichia phage vB_EcoS-26175III]QDK00512.1 hypothetical protein BNKMLPFJ_00142 [Escherichia phage vB_EcoS-26175IV]QDK00591.1 hypothetical protein JOHFDMOO_00063 [Escherichia phage vB_EcoS-26175V]WJZ69740.1 hypoth